LFFGPLENWFQQEEEQEQLVAFGDPPYQSKMSKYARICIVPKMLAQSNSSSSSSSSSNNRLGRRRNDEAFSPENYSAGALAITV